MLPRPSSKRITTTTMNYVQQLNAIAIGIETAAYWMTAAQAPGQPGTPASRRRSAANWMAEYGRLQMLEFRVHSANRRAEGVSLRDYADHLADQRARTT